MMGWDWDGGWGMGWGLFGLVHMLVWWLLIILGIVALSKFAFGHKKGDAQQDSALTILRERFARGEIGKEEFDACRRDLES